MNQSVPNDLLHVTFNSIGDAVITTDAEGRVTLLNPVAEGLTGWTTAEASGRPLEEVFRIINEHTRQPVENPASRVLREGVIVGLANHTLLIAKDGTEWPIDDSAAPIRDENGNLHGVVLVFRDISERRRAEIAEAEHRRLMALRVAVSNALAANQSLRAALQQCVEALVHHVDVVFARIWTLHEQDAVLELQASAGMYTHLDGPHSRIRVGEFKIGRIAQSRQPHLSNRVPEDANISDPEWARREGIVAFAGYPLMIGPQVYGVIAVFSRRPLSQAVLNDLAPLADSIAQFIDRKRSEEALKRSEELHRVLAELTTDYGVVCRLERDGKLLIQSLTAGFQKVTGYSLEELESEGGWPILVYPPDMPVVEQSIRRWLAGEAHTSELRVCTKDGRIRWLEYFGRAVLDVDQQTTRLYIAAQDITERKVAREELERHREWLHVTLSSIGDAVIATDTNGHITFLNGVAESLTGWKQDEAAGRPLEEVFRIVNEETRATVENPVSKALRRGTIVGLANHTILIAKQGTERPIDDSAAPIRDSHGNIIGVVLVFRDATEKRQTEEGLRRRAEELAIADRRKNEFLAMLAHELRNPLAPIRSGLSLLAMEDGESETIRLMQEQVEHLVRLVDDLLDVSRIVRGRIELCKEPVELSTVVSRAIQTVKPFLDERRHELVVAIPPEPICLNADPVRMAQVIMNLVHNSAKYTEPGGQIRLSAEQVGQGVVVRVQDNGTGIEPDLLPHIFDLFTQSERTIDRSQGGLGLGLTLVRSLVEMHDGSISVRSEGPGFGSEFVIHLPVAPQRSITKLHDPIQTSVPSRRVLVVDDNVGAAKMLQLLLTRCGAKDVYMAHDGPAALEAAKKHRPEIILLDIGLPRMNGYEVARHLQSDADFDGMLLVAVTGYGQDEDIQRSREAGFDEHMIKPPAIESLLRLFVHPKLSSC